MFIDADGQAYLYWGNPNLWYVKLNADMISYSGTPTKVSLTTAGFGARSNTDRATAYEEGPWFYKRGSLYYIVYPGDGVPENISYTTSTGPTGPWTFGSVIMDKETGAGASFTNHPGVAEFAGNSYIFYHNGALPGGGGYKRSVCVEKLTYNADGSIAKVAMTTAGPTAVATLNPYNLNEAETIAWETGIETETCGEGGLDVTSISSGDYIKLKNVDFGTGATALNVRVASASGTGNIEVRLNSQTGTLVGTCAVAATGGAQTWANKTCTISGASGVHDLFFVFTGSGGFNFNNWQFTGTGGGSPGTGGASSTGGAAAAGGTASAGGTRSNGGNSSAGGSRATGGGVSSCGSVTAGGASPSGGATTITNTGGATTSATAAAESTRVVAQLASAERYRLAVVLSAPAEAMLQVVRLVLAVQLPPAAVVRRAAPWALLAPSLPQPLLARRAPMARPTAGAAAAVRVTGQNRSSSSVLIFGALGFLMLRSTKRRSNRIAYG